MSPENKDQRFSFALAGMSGEGSIERIYEIISCTSRFAKRNHLELLAEVGALPQNLIVKGIQLRMIKLQIGAPYLAYREDPEGRGVYFLQVEHGKNDGFFNSKANLSAPEAISAKSPQTAR